jgi:hypothetical protein
LFTSYAPLNNPRLAIAVIGRGADGRNHFPVTVAGLIYRDLNGRFGVTGQQQLAKSYKSQMTDLAMSSPATDKDATEPDDSEEADEENANVAAKPKTETTIKPLGTPRQSVDSKVKRVLMPLVNRTAPTTRPNASLKTLTLPEPKAVQRPRRVTAIQP